MVSGALCSLGLNATAGDSSSGLAAGRLDGVDGVRLIELLMDPAAAAATKADESGSAGLGAAEVAQGVDEALTVPAKGAVEAPTVAAAAAAAAAVAKLRAEHDKGRPAVEVYARLLACLRAMRAGVQMPGWLRPLLIDEMRSDVPPPPQPQPPVAGGKECDIGAEWGLESWLGEFLPDAAIRRETLEALVRGGVGTSAACVALEPEALMRLGLRLGPRKAIAAHGVRDAALRAALDNGRWTVEQDAALLGLNLPGAGYVPGLRTHCM